MQNRSFPRLVFPSLLALTTLSFAFTTAMPACSSDDSDRANGGDPDVDPIAWVAPTSDTEIVVGDLVQLTVKVNDPNADAVEFSVDGKVLDRCDTSSGPKECRRDDLFRIVTTFQRAGKRQLGARYLAKDGYESATLDITVLEKRPTPTDDGGTTPLPPEDGGDDDGGIVVPNDGGTTDPPTTDRGFLDPDLPLHNVFGGVSWSVKGQRVEVVDALTTDVAQISKCMGTYGASIIKHADANKVSRGSVVATAITESNCTNPAGSSDGLSSGPMQVTGYTCRALFPGRFGSDAACTSEMHNNPDFSFEAGCKVMGEAYAINQHKHDPPKIAAQYNAGSIKESGANRWRMVVTGNHIDRFVAAYNAYRAWESMNGVAKATLATQVATWPTPVFAGEHVAAISELPRTAREGQVYFVGNWEARDGAFLTFREGRWQEH